MLAASDRLMQRVDWCHPMGEYVESQVLAFRYVPVDLVMVENGGRYVRSTSPRPPSPE